MDLAQFLPHCRLSFSRWHSSSMEDVNLLWRLCLISIVYFKASLEKGMSSLSNLGKETVRGLMVHAMVEVNRPRKMICLTRSLKKLFLKVCCSTCICFTWSLKNSFFSDSVMLEFKIESIIVLIYMLLLIK